MRYLKQLLAATALVGALAFTAPLAKAGTANGYTTAAPIPSSFCGTLTLSASTGLSSCSGGIPANAICALISASGQGVNWRDDGTAPTATLGSGGQSIPVSSSMWYCGQLSTLRFIQQSATATLSVSFYK